MAASRVRGAAAARRASDEQANLVIDCMRAYGATTLGVVANVEPPHPNGRDILGFISYGYAQALLRLDRIEEYILFLYAHRYQRSLTRQLDRRRSFRYHRRRARCSVSPRSRRFRC